MQTHERSTSGMRGRKFLAIVASSLLLPLFAACSSSSSGGEEDSFIVNGIAKSVLNGSLQADRDFVVFDLEADADADPIAVGKSDSDGVFEFGFKGIRFTFVVFPPTDNEPRTAGLIHVNAEEVGKELVAATDIACQAGVTAVREGGLDPRLLTEERIANLEAAAAQVLEEDDVNFFDVESVTAAAQRVRDLTNDGANPPASD